MTGSDLAAALAYTLLAGGLIGWGIYAVFFPGSTPNPQWVILVAMGVIGLGLLIGKIAGLLRR